MLPEKIIIPLRKDGTVGYVPPNLECWRVAMQEFVDANTQHLSIDSEYVSFIRVQLIEIEQPTLIQQLCRCPAWALKSYKLIGVK